MFLGKMVENRKQVVRDLKLCFDKDCGKRHHSLLRLLKNQAVDGIGVDLRGRREV